MISIWNQPEAQAKYKKWLQRHIFTPTEIDNYRKCPIKFFIESLLGINTRPEPDLDLTPAELGKLMHRILEQFLRTQGERLYSTAPLEPLQIMLEEQVARFLEQESRAKSHLIYPLLRRQQGRIQRTLNSFLKQEREHFELSPELKPKFFEWSFGHGTPPLEIPLARQIIRIAGRIDRIDVDEKRKHFLVIDYKTGRSRITGEQILNGDSFQLPLYLMAVQKLLLPNYEPIGGLYYHLSDLSKKDGLLHADRLPESLPFHPRSSSVLPPGCWEESLGAIQSQLTRVLENISEGVFTPAVAPCHPRCPMKSYCQPEPYVSH